MEKGLKKENVSRAQTCGASAQPCRLCAPAAPQEHSLLGAEKARWPKWGGADGFVVCCVFPLEFLRKILKNPRIGCSDKPDTFPEGTIHSSAAKKRHSSDSPGGACGGDGGSCCRARTRVA